jgi:hypothetical protein
MALARATASAWASMVVLRMDNDSVVEQRGAKNHRIVPTKREVRYKEEGDIPKEGSY